MRFKTFILVSLIIHALGALALYFYYNPLNTKPKPVTEEGKITSWFQKDKPLEKAEAPAPPEVLSTVKELYFPKKSPESQKKAPKQKPLKKSVLPKKSSPKAQNPVKNNLKKSSSKPPKSNQTSKSSPAKAPDLTNLKSTSKALPPKPSSTDTKTLDLKNSQVTKESSPPANELEDYEIVTEPKTVTPSPQTKDLKDFELIEKPLDDNQQSPEPKKPEPDIPQNITTEPKIAQNVVADNRDDFKESPEPSQKNPLKKASKDLKNKALVKKDKKNKTKNQKIKAFSTLKQKRGNESLSYPDFARREALQGTVSVLMFVNAKGFVDSIQLESSSGHAKLDNFVLRVLSRYEFLPEQQGWFRHKIPFVLKGQETESLRLRNKTK